MLGVYTEKFQNSKEVQRIFEQYNFEIEYVEYFFGCASGIELRLIAPTNGIEKNTNITQ